MNAEDEAFYASLFSGEAPQEADGPAVSFNILNEAPGRRYRLEALIDRIAKQSPAGKALLEEAAKHCSLCLSDELPDDRLGAADREEGVIYLNMNKSDEALITTLLHEARHACQFANGCASFGKNVLTVKSQLMHDRAMEADADAAAGVIAFEMAEKGDKVVFETFAKKRPETAKAIVGHAAKDPASSSNDLTEAAFKGWYDSEAMKSAYEKAYLCDALTEIMCRDDVPAPLNVALSGKDVAKLACLGGYLKDPSVLESGRYCDISPKTAAVVDKFADVAKLRGIKATDIDRNDMPVREKPAKKAKAPSLSKVLAARAASR